MNIQDYYHQRFRADLAEFMGDTGVPYFGHSWRYDCRGLDRIASDWRAHFLICLYFTVLVDQTMHCHFPHLYHRFESLTRYPKFCHGLGQFQFNPRGILTVPTEIGFVRPEAIKPLLDDGMLLFVDEVLSFFRDQMAEVSARDFFDKLIYDPDVQIPEIFVLLDKTTAERVEYVAYKALRRAVETRVPSVAA